MTVCTRFAPSPTGVLHIGSARTALFAWAFARANKGKFILRIEDTDLVRSTEASKEAILEAMAWLGLDYDVGPIYQSQRFARYREVVEELLQSDSAYRCYCTKDRLEALRKEQMAQKLKPRYDGRCRHGSPEGVAKDAPYVVRFKQPQEGQTQVIDAVHGVVTFENSELDDLVILRSDGVPTYHLSVVVDDADEAVTHVIRGDDHLANTPRQINLLRAIGKPIPHYTHIPMILGPDGKRYSKRHGADDIMTFRDKGYLPEAMLNYLIRLGWSHGDDEILSLDQIKYYFDLEHINKAAAAFDLQKCQWLNQHYIQHLPPASLIPALRLQLEKLGLPGEDPNFLEKVIALNQSRSKTLVEMAEKSRVFLEAEISEYDRSVVSKHFTPALFPAYSALLERLRALKAWEEAGIGEVIEQILVEFSLKLGKLAQPIRVAVSGGTVSPPINPTLALLGRVKTLARLENGLRLFED